MKNEERLQKILSRNGYGSRRKIEKLIAQGLVSVNGVVSKLGDRATNHDKIIIHGTIIRNMERHDKLPRVLLYHKPVGEICTRQDPKNNKTVFTSLPKLQHSRWVMVGRLDINTSGLLVFTDNGDLAYRMMHPKFGLEREYAVRVCGTVTEQMLKNLIDGVQLDDGLAKFKSIVFHGGTGINNWYHVVLTEGKNREVRRLWQSQRVEVSRLIRIRYGQLTMPRWLARGKFTELDTKHITILLDAKGV